MPDSGAGPDDRPVFRRPFRDCFRVPAGLCISGAGYSGNHSIYNQFKKKRTPLARRPFLLPISQERSGIISVPDVEKAMSFCS